MGKKKTLDDLKDRHIQPFIKKLAVDVSNLDSSVLNEADLSLLRSKKEEESSRKETVNNVKNKMMLLEKELKNQVKEKDTLKKEFEAEKKQLENAFGELIAENQCLKTTLQNMENPG